MAASPNAAFMSQIAAFSLALRQLPWKHWQASIHVAMGGDVDAQVLHQWLPHLQDVTITLVSSQRFREEKIWAQSDDVFRLAPRDADVYIAMDADTLPVGDLEPVLDEVLENNEVAGVIAHYPFPGFPDLSAEKAWEIAGKGVLKNPLDLSHRCTLMADDVPVEKRMTPFYLNFGVVFFSRQAFSQVMQRYLKMRPRLMNRLPDNAFAGQVALTLSCANAGVKTRALPMRFNYPNDVVADRLYPHELSNVVVFHYLRTGNFDRHRIFTTAQEYERFITLSLEGSDRFFQKKVQEFLGGSYPFA